LKPTVLPKPAEPAAGIEEAAAALMGRAAPSVAPPVVSPAVPPSTLLKRKHKEFLVSWSVKLPASLKAELEGVSRFNEIPMSEIVVEALRRRLGDYEHPPEGWRKGKGSRG
jgi:hypothetical protein